MKIRQYQRGVETLKKEASAILNASEDSKYIHKVAMVNLVIKGTITAADLADGLGITRQSISNWISIADKQGFEALKEKSKSGRPTKMTEEIASEIDALLQEDDPQKYGYQIWDGPSLSKYIKEAYNIDYSVRSCQRLFRDLGYSLLRAQTFPSKDPDICDNEARGASKRKFGKSLMSLKH
ncbi:MAG: helix-turn-helix domain containing protein [Clostridia bacterium]|nr:helix-turn-helix domain containing protein [Clostridia bacterium]